jgi:hypothetical protein
MAWGRQRAEWHHTSALLAMLAAVNRDPRKQPRAPQPSDFHPFEQGARRPQGMPVNKQTFDTFLAMFVSPEKLAQHQAERAAWLEAQEAAA